MLTYLVAFLLSAAVATVLTPLLRNLALRRGWVDAPTEARKVHETPIPRVGGVAIAIAFFVPVVGLFFWDNDVSYAYLRHADRVTGLFVGAAAIVALGLVDDIRGLRAWQKFLAQNAVALTAFLLGYQINVVANPFGDPIALGMWSLPVTMLWIVGIMNAMNLIDGLDGLAGGIALFTVLTLFVLAVMNANVIVGLTSIALAGALVGFLRYNFNPASVFMGDAGSLFLGYVLSISAISGSAKSSTVVSLLIPMLALGLPMMDTTMAVFRRLIAGRPIFSADRGHVHHRLLDLGLTHRQAVLAMYAVAVALGLGALSLVYANSVETAVILAAFAVATIALGKSLGYLSLGEVSQSLRYGLLRQRRLRRTLEAIEEAGAAVRTAPTVDAALDRVVELAQAVGADGVSCRLAVTGPWGLERHDARWPEPVGAAGVLSPGATATPRRITFEYALDWGLADVETAGALAIWWDCEDEHLQVPEASGYDWVAMILRDRVLQLARQARAVPYQPRLAEES